MTEHLVSQKLAHNSIKLRIQKEEGIYVLGRAAQLGLRISKGIIEEHGGTLFIDTVIPNTCFVIELPIQSAPS